MLTVQAIAVACLLAGLVVGYIIGRTEESKRRNWRTDTRYIAHSIR